jgi:peptidoglycan-N-acetylglucosamine deacetylase
MRSSGPEQRAGLLLAALLCGVTTLLVPPAARTVRGAEHPVPVRLVAAAPTLPRPTPGPGEPDTSRVARPGPAQARPPVPPPPGVLVEQRGSRSGKPTVVLTFDDGPDPAWTPQVLALLKRYRAKATFCMIGEHARAHPDLVEKVVKAGHRLCDHTRTHPRSVAVLGRGGQRAEIVGGRSDLATVTKARVRYFRAPGGNWSPDMVELASSAKLVSVHWSVDPRDWSQPGVAAIVSTVQNGMHPGAIVLMHDGGGPRQQTVEALGQLLPWLVEHGYRFGFPTS